VTEGWTQRTENQLDVVGRTISQAPSAIMEEVFNDVTQRPVQVLENSAIAGAIGFGATVLFRRAPVIGTLIAGGAVLAESCRLLPKVSSFLSAAGDADTREKRIAVARQGALGIGREGAMFVETLPAAGLGSKLGLSALENSAFARNLSYAVAEKAEFPLRRALPDDLLFKGPGTKIKPGLMTGTDTADALGASRLLPSPKPFSVEYGRVIDPRAGRMSWKLPGLADSVETGVVQKPGQFSVHLQNPYVEAPGVPSVPDLRSVPKDSLGIINAGENTTFFVGKGNAPIAAGADLDVQAVVLDHKMKEAFLHDYMASADTKTYGLTNLKQPVKLNYDEALKALQRVDLNNPWNSLSGIARAETPGLSRVAGSLDLTGTNGSFTSRIKTRLNLGDGAPTLLRSTLTGSNPLFQIDGRAKS